MKTISTFIIPIINISVFLSLATFAFSRTPAIVSLPEDSSISCEGSIRLVKSDLSKRGFFVPWKIPRSSAIGNSKVKFDKSLISEGYYDYPTGRTEAVIFVLGNVTNLYSSPKFMTTLASKIMAECNKVGLVEFSYWWEGFERVGYFPDNTARHFFTPSTYLQWEDVTKTIKTSQGDRLNFKWGYALSP